MSTIKVLCGVSGTERTSIHADAMAGITFIWAGSPACSTVGVIHDVAEVRIGAVGHLHLAFENAERGDRRSSRTVRVPALERHRAVRHLAVEVEPQAQRSLGDVTDLATLGLAADHAVDAVGMTARHEVLGAGHHAFLVDEGAEHHPARERTMTLDGIGGEQHRRQPTLHVGRAATPETAARDLSTERVDGPRRVVALGDDVGVPFEHQRRAGAVAVDNGDHVRTTRCDDVDLR